MAGAEYLSYYPPWGDYRLGRVNYEDLEFTLSNIRGGMPTSLLEKQR